MSVTYLLYAPFHLSLGALYLSLFSSQELAGPVWKPMHKQPVYADAPRYTNGVEEELFKVGFCLPAGPYVSDDDVSYIVDCLMDAIDA